jgi:aldehyde dehydrogenase (NAD+)/aldehyde dehydrogenase
MVRFYSGCSFYQEDIDLALDAAHEAFPSWSTTSVTERNMLLKIAQVMEDNLEYLATLETIDNGKPIRESQLISLIVSITSVISLVLSVQMKEVSLNMTKNIKHRFTRAYWGCWRNHSLEFPNANASLESCSALATGCTAVVKPAEQTQVLLC